MSLQQSKPLVSVRELKTYYEDSSMIGKQPPVRAVDGVSLDVHEGETLGVVGESGCGKTTLGETALGVQRPTSGTVSFRGQDVWEAKAGHDDAEIPFEEVRRSLQMIQQDPSDSLNPNRKVTDTLAEPLKRWSPGMSRQDREARILGFLEHVGMNPPEDYAQRYPFQLSGGEKQRVALIRALLMNPDLILADEAVSALDVSLRVEMMDLMHELQDLFDTSYLFISHNLSNARYFAGKVDGRIGVMYLGELVEIGPVDQVINDPRHPYTKVLLWSTADLDMEEEAEEPPIRGIDIPDPEDPPSGCRFHTRCPEAREACREQTPGLGEGAVADHGVACFREYGEDHPYWDSEPLADDEADSSEPALSGTSD